MENVVKICKVCGGAIDKGGSKYCSKCRAEANRTRQKERYANNATEINKRTRVYRAHRAAIKEADEYVEVDECIIDDFLTIRGLAERLKSVDIGATISNFSLDDLEERKNGPISTIEHKTRNHLSYLKFAKSFFKRILSSNNSTRTNEIVIRDIDIVDGMFIYRYDIYEWLGISTKELAIIKQEKLKYLGKYKVK